MWGVGSLPLTLHSQSGCGLAEQDWPYVSAVYLRMLLGHTASNSFSSRRQSWSRTAGDNTELHTEEANGLLGGVWLPVYASLYLSIYIQTASYMPASCLLSTARHMFLKLLIRPVLQAGLFNGNVDSLLGALTKNTSKHISSIFLGIFLTVEIDTFKCWNQAPLAICRKYKADLSQGCLFKKPWFCYCYKWIPKSFLAPKRGKTIFPSYPPIHFHTHFLTHNLRIHLN